MSHHEECGLYSCICQVLKERDDLKRQLAEAKQALYFNSHKCGQCEAMALNVDLLRTALSELRNTPSLWRVGRAGGQDQYAGLPPACRVIDEALRVGRSSCVEHIRLMRDVVNAAWKAATISYTEFVENGLTCLDAPLAALDAHERSHP